MISRVSMKPTIYAWIRSSSLAARGEVPLIMFNIAMCWIQYVIRFNWLNTITLDSQPREQRRLSGEIYRRAAARLDSRGRLLLLREMHHVLGSNMDLESAGMMAVRRDDLPCYIYAHDNRAFRYGMPMALAVELGALSVLKYGLGIKQHFYLYQGILREAVYYRRVDIAHLVLRAVEKHYSLKMSLSTQQLALPIAAAQGHLPCVCYLHAHGCPLWDSLRFIPDAWFASGVRRKEMYIRPPTNCLFVSEASQYGQSMLGVLWYGEMHGAPVLEWFPIERRERARQVLLCFHGASRLSRGGGEHARLLGVMGNVPLDVLYRIPYSLYVILVGAEVTAGKGPSGPGLVR
jgi:hypothetical protein